MHQEQQRPIRHSGESGAEAPGEPAL
ncbi:MAG: hypothetical protein QOI90_1854, partial [Mycobacterium sp.]|nr:hypothetical protein [Mycobacterium sp.]